MILIFAILVFSTTLIKIPKIQKEYPVNISDSQLQKYAKSINVSYIFTLLSSFCLIFILSFSVYDTLTTTDTSGGSVYNLLIYAFLTLVLLGCTIAGVLGIRQTTKLYINYMLSRSTRIQQQRSKSAQNQ